MNSAPFDKQPQQQAQTQKRPEMRGPNVAPPPSINNILSGLKTRPSQSMNELFNINSGEDKDPDVLSTISIEDLKGIKDLTSTKLPKSKRKQKSDKNIVSLDI